MRLVTGLRQPKHTHTARKLGPSVTRRCRCQRSTRARPHPITGRARSTPSSVEPQPNSDLPMRSPAGIRQPEYRYAASSPDHESVHGVEVGAEITNFGSHGVQDSPRWCAGSIDAPSTRSICNTVSSTPATTSAPPGEESHAFHVKRHIKRMREHNRPHRDSNTSTPRPTQHLPVRVDETAAMFHVKRTARACATYAHASLMSLG